MISVFLLLFLITSGQARGLLEADDKNGKSEESKDMVVDGKDQSGANDKLSECKGCKDIGEVSKTNNGDIKTDANSKTTTTRPTTRKSKPFLTFHRIKVKVDRDKDSQKINTTLIAKSADYSEVNTENNRDKNLSQQKSSQDKFAHPQSRENVTISGLEGGTINKQIPESEKQALGEPNNMVVKISKSAISSDKQNVTSINNNKKKDILNKNLDDLDMQTDSHNGAVNLDNVVSSANLKKQPNEPRNNKESESNVQNKEISTDKGNAPNSRKPVTEQILKSETNVKVRIDENKENVAIDNMKDTDSEENGMTDIIEDEEKPQGNRAGVDHILPVNAGDRWSRKDLKQVPDVERLERRLHPTVNAPVEDIIQSMKTILRFLQERLQKVDADFDKIHNTTRWKYMMGVREHLGELARDNDQIYSVVMEASLLTKEIYRKAHEHRRIRPGVEAEAVAYRSQMSRSRDSMHPLLRQAYLGAQAELDKAHELSRLITNSRKQRDHLRSNLHHMHDLVRSRLPLHALDDLYRRADQTMRLISAAQPLSRMGDRSRLYSHMGNATFSNMKRARELMKEGSDLLTHVRSSFMKSKQMVQEHQKMMMKKVDGDGAGVLADMPFHEGRMDRFVAWDSAVHHGKVLSDEAAFIHMKLSSLISKGKEVISDRASISFERRLEQSVKEMRETIKLLVKTMDKIRLLVGDDKILQERCEDLEGSGGFSDDDDVPLIDCEPYVTLPEGSGDDLEGSGELEVPVDVDITEMHTGTEATNSTVDVDITKDKHAIVGKTSKAPIVIINEDTDDEDIFKEKPTKISTKQPEYTTTAKPPSSSSPSVETTKKSETSDNDFVFTDLFGWFNDQPDGDVIQIEGDLVDSGLTALPIKRSLNEFIRERLMNYSQESKLLHERAITSDAKIKEISSTWEKVSGRFSVIENKTVQARSIIIKWRAEKAVFQAVHDRVLSADKDITVNAVVIDNQCKTAVGKAENKLQTMTETYNKEKDKTKNAADPAVVKEAVDQVSVVTNGVREIRRLKQVYPDPCGILDNYERKIKSNITELRKKIERAKLIASTLQVAVALPSDDFLELPISNEASSAHPLTSNVQLMLRHSGKSGQLMSLKIGKDNSLSVELEDAAMKVKQSVDGNKKTTALHSEDITDKWYMLQLERFSSLYNVTLHGEDGLLSKVGIDMFSTKSATKSTETLPASLRLGGSKDFAVCSLGLQIDGQNIQLFGKNFTRVGNLNTCQSQRSLPSDQQHMLLDGSGYAVFGLESLRFARRLDKLSIVFNPRSDGTVMHFESKPLSTEIDVLVTNGILVIYIKYFDYETHLETTVQVYSANQTLEISVSSGRGRNVNVLLNGKSNVFKATTGAKRNISAMAERIYIGGFDGNIDNSSSLVGCLKSLTLNNEDVPFSNMLEADGVTFGTCIEQQCVQFDDQSSPVVLTDMPKVNKIHIAVKRGSLGPILQFSKHKQKFNLTVAVDTEGLSLEETVKEKSKKMSLDKTSKFVIVAIHDKSESESLVVSSNGQSEEFSYKSGGGAWGWGAGEKKTEGSISYSLSIGESSESDLEFLGVIQDVIIDGRPLDLMQYVTTNNLKRCTLDPAPRKPSSPWEPAVKRQCG